MSTTDALADPLVSSLAALLTVPLTELYALLWRVGVVEIAERSPARPSPSWSGPADPDFPAFGSAPPSPRLRQRRHPVPGPTRGGQSECTRATG
ncbi:Rv1535 domain-containing protein [Mycobacterium bourgelatii]|uniref:Rv1535 domain-containing protein n=1 Tax=Mycobacterium bourgelatii TaxID=1273442 RepID=UPI001F0863E9|nr:Rv1535 domain-containing protein [Mycobacterium bourgelatii]